jgi:hypothetical protein
MNFRRLAQRLPDFFTEPLLLIIAFFASITLAPLVQAPFKNPYNISNQFSALGFNPDNNYRMLVFIIVATIAFFILLRRLYSTKYAWIIKVIAVGILLSNHFIFNMLNISIGYYPTDIIYANGIHTMDNFHSGEQLSPANAFLSGSKLYSDIFYLRGAGVDVLIPSLGFILFGKTIGSFLLINHILMMATLIAFFWLVSLVVKGPLRYVAVITLFYISNSVSLVQIRDIPVFIVIGLVLLLFRKNLSELHKKLILSGIGLLSSLELFVAIDRGILLVTLAGMLTMALMIVSADKANSYSFDPRHWKQNIRVSLYIVYGILAGLLVPGALLGWHSFAAFLKMTFVDIPKYGGLLVSTQFPPIFSPEYLIWGPVIITIATGYLLLNLYKSNTTREINKELNQLLPYTLLFIFAVLTIKAGSNRIHILKMATVVAPLYFICFIILIYALQLAYRNRAKRIHLIPPIAILIISFGVFSQLDYTKMRHQPMYTHSELSRYKHMPQSPDDYWIKEETRQVRDYIVANTTPKDYIYVLPSNPAYYYLTNRKNPSRFYESWFTDPQPYTNELLAGLKAHRPKVIVYSEATWMDAPDTVSMKDRIPEVNDWILKNYTKEYVIGNTRLLELP